VEQNTDFKFWSPEKTASVLGLSAKTLANDRVTGRLELPHHKFGGAVRYRSDEVLGWADARRRMSTSDSMNTIDGSNPNQPRSTSLKATGVDHE